MYVFIYTHGDYVIVKSDCRFILDNCASNHIYFGA